VGQRWLRLTAMRWLGDVERIVQFLGLPHPNQQALVAEMVVPALHANRNLRELLADRLVSILRSPEAAPGAHDGYARVVQEALAEECNQRLTVAELAAWLERGSPSAQATAAHLLASRRDAVGELGLERLAAIAQHDLAKVRAAARTLVRSEERRVG